MTTTPSDQSPDRDSPFVLEPVRRAAAGEPAHAPASRAASGYLDELEGAFELEALGGYPQVSCGEHGDAPEQPEVTWELEPGFERLAPGAATGVGRGQSNVRDDVLRVQARLRQIGMSWVPDSGVIGAAKDDPTDHAIRLFRAMLDATQLWKKDKHASPCYGTPLVKNAGVILPGSREEQWLWSAGAPRWLTTIPAQRDGWCCNDGAAEAGCRTDIAEPAMSDWLAAYLDQVGPAFRSKVQAFRPVIATLATKDGQAALERLKNPGLPRLGPFSDEEEDRKWIAAIAQRVATDLVAPAIALKLDPTDLAAQTLGAIDGGRVTLMLTYLAVPHGGCSANHLGHQQGLEFDLRLFAHDGPRPGLTWDNRTCSRLLTGLAVDCFLDHPFTRQVIYCDPEIRKRAKSRVPSVETADGHDNHVHVGIKGADVHPLIPPPPPAPPAPATRWGVTVEPLLAASSNEYDLPAEREEPTGAAARKTQLIGDYIALVRKVEASYPQWSADQVLNALRHHAGYDDPLFRLMYNTPEGSLIRSGDGTLTPGDLVDLKEMSSHGSGIVEKGIVLDELGNEVAIGHVLCGLSAGAHRNRSVGLVGTIPVLAVAQILAGLTLDNLYATTITGDLGQSAVRFHTGQKTVLLGAGSEATDAELIGDIDGCVLGSNGGLGGGKVSDVLSRYYSVSSPAPSGISAANRFRLFTPHLAGAVLQDQTSQFAKFYFVAKVDTFRGAKESVAPEVQQVVALFRAWHLQRLTAETVRNAGTHPAPSAPMGDGTRRELYASLEFDAPTAAAGAKILPELRVWNADNLDTSVKFSVDEATATTAITIVTRTPGGGSASNTMVLTDARKSADGTSVTGFATNQPDGTGKTFTAYLKLQALPTEMVVLVYKKVGAFYIYVPGMDRHYRYQDAARAQKDLVAFIGSLQLGPAQFEVEPELRLGGDADHELTSSSSSIGAGLDFEEVTRPEWKIDDSALLPGDIIVSTTRNPGSWAIRVATGSRVSHALLYIGDGNVVEAMVPDPVACKPLADALVDDKYSYALRYEGLSADQRKNICDFALRQVQEKKPFGINLVSVLFRRGSESTDDKFFCSELVLKAYAAAGVPLGTWSSGPPKDIAQLAGNKLTYLGHLKVTKRQERQLEKAAAKQQEAGDDSERLEPTPDLNEL